METQTQKINKCNCQNTQPTWLKWVKLMLLIAIFILCCVMVHYLWKLSDIWQAVKNSK